MRAFFESAFEIFYLITVISTGIRMIRQSKTPASRLFGIMAVILGTGDAFHLIPRIVALCTTGLQDYTVSLGIGKLVTSITMTVFYVLLYHVGLLRYSPKPNSRRDAAVYVLAALRIALCLFPQNAWTSPAPPLSWGIYRNIPFVILGLLIILFFYNQAKEDVPFRRMWLAIVLSFAFYIPVVLWAGTVPIIGMLMIPKTCAYLWIVHMGLRAMKQE